MIEPSAADRIVPVDLESGYRLPAVDGKRRPEAARVAKDGGGHVHRSLFRALGEAEREPVPGGVRPVLPAFVSSHRAEEVDRLVALRGRVRKVAVLVREGTATERERPAGFLRMPREDLDLPGEGRDAIERALRPLHDLDPVDVLDGNLGERRVERATRRNAV